MSPFLKFMRFSGVNTPPIVANIAIHIEDPALYVGHHASLCSLHHIHDLLKMLTGGLALFTRSMYQKVRLEMVVARIIAHFLEFFMKI